MAINSQSSSHSIRNTRRYWRRTNTPRSWWPWGLLPVLGLGFLFLFGAMITAPEIQAEVRNQVTKRLGSAGVVTSDVSANGRRVSAVVDAARYDDVSLHALAQSTTCDTWAGQLNCPSIVDIERTRAEATVASLERRPHQFNVERTDDEVTLRGEVPSVAEHNRILGAAGEIFGQFNDELTISNELATQHFSPAADRALSVVDHLVSGEASWSGESLSVIGTTNAEDMATVREQFGTPGSSSTIGSFDVQALGGVDESQRCNEAFAEILTNATIRFQTNSATIDDGNEELIERLAVLARGCPGTLTVEGHTDSRGDADMNKALSLARADSVRDALAALGVDVQRVSAVGFGEASPVADNASAEGRARNRRIAIAVDTSN